MKTKKKRPEPRPLIVPTLAALKITHHHLEAERLRILAAAEVCERNGDDGGAVFPRMVAEDFRQVAQMLADQIALRTP